MSEPVTFAELKKRWRKPSCMPIYLGDGARSGCADELESLEQRVREVAVEMKRRIPELGIANGGPELAIWLKRLTALLGEPQRRGPAGDGTEGQAVTSQAREGAAERCER